MRKIFLTGATGVIGRRAIPMLTNGGSQVTAAVRSREGAALAERLHARPVLLDLLDPVAVPRAVDGHDVVVNLATHMPASTWKMFLPGAWHENDRIRRHASRLLVDAAIVGGATRFVQESFALAYPDRGDEWVDESTPLEPARYNRTLLDAERSAERFCGHRGGAVVLRFAALYGPDAMLREMIRLVRRGWSPLPVCPDAYVSSVSQEDAAAAVAAAIDARPGTYNVVDDVPIRRREFADSLASALGAPPPRFAPSWIAPLMGSIGETLARSIRVSNRKLRDATGWAPRLPSVAEGWPSVLEQLEREDAVEDARGKAASSTVRAAEASR